jgi:hypothetical protein
VEFAPARSKKPNPFKLIGPITKGAQTNKRSRTTWNRTRACIHKSIMTVPAMDLARHCHRDKLQNLQWTCREPRRHKGYGRGGGTIRVLRL